MADAPTITYPKIVESEAGSLAKFLPLGEFAVVESYMTLTAQDHVRGLAAQTEVPQAKLIQVLAGAINLNAVCLAPESPTYGEVFSYQLEPITAGGAQVLIPAHWALGYRALEDETRVLYLTDAPWHGASRGVNPSSEELYWGDTAQELTFDQKSLLLPTYSTLFPQKAAHA